MYMCVCVGGGGGGGMKNVLYLRSHNSFACTDAGMLAKYLWHSQSGRVYT